MSSFFKMIGAVFTLWLGLFFIVMGAASTGVAVVVLTLGLGVFCLVGATWLSLYLLRRDGKFDLHLPLIALLVVGGAVVVYLAFSLLRNV